MKSAIVCFAFLAITFAQVNGDCDTTDIKATAKEIEGLYWQFYKDVYASAWRIQKGAFKCSMEGPLKYRSCVHALYKTEEAELAADVKEMNATIVADWTALIAEIKECEASSTSADCDKDGIEADLKDLEVQYHSLVKDIISASWTIQKGAWECQKQGPLKFMSCVRGLYKTNLAALKTETEDIYSAVKTDAESLEAKLKECKSDQ